MKEIAPDIFMITETVKSRFVNFSVNVFVIAGKDGLVFDSGYGTKKTTAYLEREIRKIEKLKKSRGEECHITRAIPSHGHWDHFSGLMHLRKCMGLKVLVTERMNKSIRSKKDYRRSFRGETKIVDVPVSRFAKFLYRLWHDFLDETYFKIFAVKFISGPVEIVKENSELIVNGELWKILYAPGHCDDHIVLYNRARGIVFVGDNVLRSVTTWLGPPRSNLEEYIKSLKYLRGLPGLKLLFSAHGSVVTNPYERLDEAIAHREKKTEEVFGTIKNAGKKGITFDELFKDFYPSRRFYSRYIARGWILVTLEYLISRGHIESYVAGKKRRFIKRE